MCTQVWSDLRPVISNGATITCQSRSISIQVVDCAEPPIASVSFNHGFKAGAFGRVSSWRRHISLNQLPAFHRSHPLSHSSQGDLTRFPSSGTMTSSMSPYRRADPQVRLRRIRVHSSRHQPVQLSMFLWRRHVCISHYFAIGHPQVRLLLFSRYLAVLFKPSLHESCIHHCSQRQHVVRWKG